MIITLIKCKCYQKKHFDIDVNEVKKQQDLRVSKEKSEGHQVHVLDVTIRDDKIEVWQRIDNNKKSVYYCEMIDDGVYSLNENVFDNTSFLGKSLISDGFPFKYTKRSFIIKDDDVKVYNKMLFGSTKKLAESKIDESVFDLNACYYAIDGLFSGIFYDSMYKDAPEDVPVVINEYYKNKNVKSIFELKFKNANKMGRVFCVVFDDKTMNFAFKMNDRCYGFTNILEVDYINSFACKIRFVDVSDFKILMKVYINQFIVGDLHNAYAKENNSLYWLISSVKNGKILDEF
jgi:hypothetical protein